MDQVATMNPRERANLFRETATQRNLHPQIVEKDFWVCWVLKQIFEHHVLSQHLIFKGGTSLSKVFGLIHRFSEDIDLAVDWEMLGFTGERDPMAEMSRNKRDKLLKEMLTTCRNFIGGELKSMLEHAFTAKLQENQSWSIAVDQTAKDSLVFTYPATDEAALAYIRAGVVLELGTHAELLPNGRYTIRPYAAELFPDVFQQPDGPVVAITAERNFWEKATILHAEYHRPKDKPLPGRYSRHYYDVAMMSTSAMASGAIADDDLLARVVEHKKRFYSSSWAQYDLAKRGTLRLVPESHRLDELRQDYDQMKVMIFGQPPELNAIIEQLEALESRINDNE